MGSGHLHRLAYDSAFQLLAVCDVDGTRREAAKKSVEDIYGATEATGTYRGCAAYNDYREILARGDIDAVVVVTPDHWHALQSIDAARAGKDIYCEKPVSATLLEGRRLVEAVQRYGRVFQTGTQYRSIPAIRKVCQFIRDGRLVDEASLTREGLAEIETVLLRTGDDALAHRLLQGQPFVRELVALPVGLECRTAAREVPLLVELLVRAEVAVHQVTPRRRSLEDLYLSHYGGAGKGGIE